MNKANSKEIDIPETQANLEKQLIEGYQYSIDNDPQLMEDFKHIDLENWDDK